jgi:hypothetical protein
MRQVDQERGDIVAVLAGWEQTQFKRGQRYFGLYSVVAKKFNTSNSRVIEAARSENSSIELRRALRAEMARVDAEIAAKSGGAKA